MSETRNSRKRKRGTKKLDTVTSSEISGKEIQSDHGRANIPNFSPQSSQELNMSPGEAKASNELSHMSSCSRLAQKRSPSPARVSLQREHTELQTLNERLSSHAENVKQLQAENARLKLQVQAMDAAVQRESVNMKQLHGSEVKALQDLIDCCNEEKAKLSTLFEEEKLERERLGAELWDKDVEIASLCDKLETLKTAGGDYQKLRLEFEAAEAALKESRQDVERLSSELLKEKRCNRRLEQEASASKERYLKEVEQARTRFSQHMQHTDQKLEEGYEVMVTSALASLRQQHVRDLEGLKAEMTSNYMAKITDLKSACEVAEADLLAVRREVKAMRQEQDKVRDQVTQLKSEKAALEVQLSETQARLAESRDVAERERCRSQREVALLTQDLAEQKEEVEQLGGINARLEAEIKAYRLIMEDLEGQKFSCVSKAAKEVRPRSTRGGAREKKEKASGANPMTKADIDKTVDVFERKDYFRTNDFSCGVEIVDVDVTGRYITLVNTTDHPTDLCLWTVQQTDGRQTVKYELGTSTQLPRGKRLTLWSCDAGPQTTVGEEEEMTEGQTSPNRLCSRPKRSAIVDNCCLEDGGIHVTMSSRVWLKLDNKQTIRVEDGDGQLQAKCDISSVTDLAPSVTTQTVNVATDSSSSSSSSSKAKSSSTFNSSRGSVTTASAASKKRPRLADAHYVPPVSRSRSSTNNDQNVNTNSAEACEAGMSSSESCLLKAESGEEGDDGSEYMLASNDNVCSRRHPHDKDSCRLM